MTDYTNDWVIADLKSQLSASRAETERMERLLDGCRELLRKERAEKVLLMEQLTETLAQIEETNDVLRRANQRF